MNPIAMLTPKEWLRNWLDVISPAVTQESGPMEAPYVPKKMHKSATSALPDAFAVGDTV